MEQQQEDENVEPMHPFPARALHAMFFRFFLLLAVLQGIAFLLQIYIICWNFHADLGHNFNIVLEHTLSSILAKSF